MFNTGKIHVIRFIMSLDLVNFSMQFMTKILAVLI